MGKIILVTGGARSGKSTFAENYVKDLNTSKAYIATAQIFDEEMRQRIDIHKQRRANEWHTIESPFNAEEAINACHNYPAVLFDCITIYMSNIICLPEANDMEPAQIQSKILQSIDKLITAAQKHPGSIVFVTNEVGAGIVPENKLARLYRDIAGICNQHLAQNADEVYFVISGIPLKIK